MNSFGAFYDANALVYDGDEDDHSEDCHGIDGSTEVVAKKPEMVDRAGLDGGVPGINGSESSPTVQGESPLISTGHTTDEFVNADGQNCCNMQHFHKLQLCRHPVISELRSELARRALLEMEHTEATNDAAQTAKEYAAKCKARRKPWSKFDEEMDALAQEKLTLLNQKLQIIRTETELTDRSIGTLDLSLTSLIHAKNGKSVKSQRSKAERALPTTAPEKASGKIHNPHYLGRPAKRFGVTPSKKEGGAYLLPTQPTCPTVQVHKSTSGKTVNVSWTCALAEDRKVIGYELSCRSNCDEWGVVYAGHDNAYCLRLNGVDYLELRVRANNEVGWGTYSTVCSVDIKAEVSRMKMQLIEKKQQKRLNKALIETKNVRKEREQSRQRNIFVQRVEEQAREDEEQQRKKAQEATESALLAAKKALEESEENALLVTKKELAQTETEGTKEKVEDGAEGAGIEAVAEDDGWKLVTGRASGPKTVKSTCNGRTDNRPRNLKCRYFGTSRGCKEGKACRFVHEAEAKGGLFVDGKVERESREEEKRKKQDAMKAEECLVLAERAETSRREREFRATVTYDREFPPLQTNCVNGKVDHNDRIHHQTRVFGKCRFLGTNRGCKDGDKCPFVHDPTVSGNVKIKVTPRGVCHFFNTPKGCRNGDACPFLHQ
ncbi:hypothetical protein HDU76_013068 [Blyttiomyces sp. JEL0837]|nr:hypothetical protein HDU76_013068 [Blyttiomyces sp. JEL0837]